MMGSPVTGQVKAEVRLCVVGSSTVGKSSIVKRFTQAHFGNDYIATVGADYDSRIIEHDGCYVQLHLYDVSGQESFLWMAKKQVHEADGFLIVYDVTDRASFVAADRWLRLVRQYDNGRPRPAVLAGNKADLRHHQVTSSEAKEFAIPENMEQAECSASSGRNVAVLFYLLTGAVLRHRRLGCGTRSLGGCTPTVRPSVYEEPSVSTKLPDDSPDYTHMFRILLVGGQRVGKTALRFRFCRDHYSPEYFASSGLDFSTRTLLVDGEKVKVQLWDVSGDAVYDATRKGYYKGANGFLIVYDVGSDESFAQADRLLKELDMYGQSDSPKLVVGCKKDLVDRRQVPYMSAREWADGWRLPLVEVSARTGDDVDDAVMKLVMALKKQMAPWKRIYDFSK